MEQQSSLFSLVIDPLTKMNLSETAKWARFLAVIGFVFLLMMIVAGIYSSITISRFEDSYREMGLGGKDMTSGVGISVAVMYSLMAIIAFFPLLFIFRFASQMKTALTSNDQALLNVSFHNLKVCFRYLGIVTIISMMMVVLSLLLGIAGLALSS